MVSTLVRCAAWIRIILTWRTISFEIANSVLNREAAIRNIHAQPVTYRLSIIITFTVRVVIQ